MKKKEEIYSLFLLFIIMKGFKETRKIEGVDLNGI
jgi:hypothetical protein